MMRWGVVVAVLVGTRVMFVGPAAHADKKDIPFFQKPSLTPQLDAEKRAAELATPQALIPPEQTQIGSIRTVRVRVYADLDYRAVTPNWQQRVRALFHRVNDFVEPGFSVHLEIQALRPWDRRSAGTALTAALPALEALDPGADVDWVIGLASPLPGVTDSIHELGLAPMLGKHFVLRGMDDPAESLSIDRNLHRLSDEQRDALYRSRKQHRETVIFIHEWAHTLGALHDLDPHRIMNATYRPTQATMSSENVAVIRLALEARIDPAHDLRPMLAFVEAEPFDDARSQDREVLLRLLHAHAGPAVGAQAAVLPASPVSPRPTPDVVRPSVSVGARTSASSGANPALTTPDRDLAGVVRQLVAQGKRIEAKNRIDQTRRPPPAEPSAAAAYTAIADAYHELGIVTLTEQALARAGTAPGVVDLALWASVTRARVGLPKDAAPFQIAVDDEAAYVDTVDHIAGRIAAGDDRHASTLIRDGLARFPGAPGLLALRCDIELHAGRRQIARRTCSAALVPDDGVARAHALLGSMDLEDGRRDDARKHILRALTLDPSDREAMKLMLTLHR